MTATGRIVLWCDGGANQKALAHKIHSRFGLAGLVVERRPARRRALAATWKRVLERLFGGRVDAAWMRLLDRYQRHYPDFPDVPSRVVANVNSEPTSELTRTVSADLVLVSGTGMVKEPLLSLPLPVGILNLHTGLSPYVKGGPNCTNWCLANGAYHLIGNTVMWIDAGIDSGTLVATRPVDFDGGEDLHGIQWRVMEEAHRLTLETIEAVLLNPRAPWSIPQSAVGDGTTHYNREWDLAGRRRVLENLRLGRFRDAVTSPAFRELRTGLRTVALPR
jgi:methionyl-tRNA formyltransferase